MAILLPTSAEKLHEHFTTEAGGNETVFVDNLKKLSPRKLKACAEAVNVTMGGKDETISEIVKEIKGMNGATQAASPSKEEKPKVEKPKKKEAEVKTPVAEEKPKVVTKAKGKAVTLVINEHYKKMVPRPTKEQVAIMTASIEAEGLHEKLVARRSDKVIIDGHSRYDILQKLGISITEDMVEYIDIPEEEVEKEVFIRNIARRQLATIDKIRWARKYLSDLLQADRKMGAPKKDAKPAPSLKPKQRLEKIADVTGTSQSTITRQEWCEKYCPEILKAEEEKDKDGSIGRAWNIGKQFEKTIKAYAPELWKEVEAGTMRMNDAHVEAIALKEKAKVEKAFKPGPMETVVTKMKAQYMKRLEAKYARLEVKEWAPDEDEALFISDLDSAINGFHKKNV